MRLALKHQIIMAPAVVLFMMTVLLGFLQFTYWDLSVKRQQAKDLKTAFIAVAEADMAIQRMQVVVRVLSQSPTPPAGVFEQMTQLHQHLDQSVLRLTESTRLSASSLSLLQQSVIDLNPVQGMKLERFETALGVLRPHLGSLLEELNSERHNLASLHSQDMDELVAETTFVTILVLGFSILVGILLSLTFARRILSRIQVLSESAEKITLGDFDPPPAPEVIRDELDGLSVSINRMTDQLIRVVSAEKLLEGAEEERRRIAMDIHDQTLADLSSVRRQIEQMRETDACNEAAVEIEDSLQRAITNLRVVMDNLHPQTLDILGLPAAIEAHLEKVCPGEELEFHLLVEDTANRLSLPRLTQVTLYRIVVEAVHNVIRHAQATRLEVGLSVSANRLMVAVEDNGCGFDYKPQPPGSTGGRGLHNIRERANAIGAKVDWTASRFSSGTRFELMLPLAQD